MANERVYKCVLGDLAETVSKKQVAPPAVFVIGEVAGLNSQDAQ